MNTNPTQAECILRVLEKRRGTWVSMPTLAEQSGAYAVHSRVAELRKRGHRIGNQVMRHGHQAVSFYRLEDAP